MKMNEPIRVLGYTMLIFISMSVPAAITITGKVTGPTGNPIAGAFVTLVNKTESAVTDGQGRYSISSSSITPEIRSDKKNKAKIFLKNGTILFSALKDNTFVKIDLFNTYGQRIRSYIPQRGECSVTFLMGKTSSQVYLVGLQIGDSYDVYRIPLIGNFEKGVISLPAIQGASSEPKLLKFQGIAIDTIKVSAAGFINGYAPIENYVATIDISLRNQMINPKMTYTKYTPKSSDMIINRSDYINRLHGFWLGENLANWTGLITEMDRVGMPRTGAFYTDQNWGGPDFPSMWGASGLSSTITWLFTNSGTPWGADDDTDMEYLYMYLLDADSTCILTGEQIKKGWLDHIFDNLQPTPYGKDDDPTGGYQNYLWISNQKAFELMRDKGMVPPATGDPVNNQYYNQIDAQLTTESFGFYAPCRTDIADSMAYLPIRTTASGDAEQIARFYVNMYSLASYALNVEPYKSMSMKDKIFWMVGKAYAKIPKTSYASKMYDFIKAKYDANTDKNNWESTRDSVYNRYQGYGNSVISADGYSFTGYGNGQSNSGPSDAGINFAASLISLFYGQGDMPRTLEIGVLCGWDSDNPTATWGGLLGFMIGKDGIEKVFNKTNFSDTYLISRTRKNFPDLTPGIPGEDSFPLMAQRGVYIVDRVVQEQMHGGVDPAKDVWYIPDNGGF